MKTTTRIELLFHFLKWRLTWGRRDTRYERTIGGNPKFMGPRRAAALIRDGSVLMASGLGGNARPSILYWAIRELFEETGHPRGLTVMAIGGIGGRGKAPGTLEELGVEGLTTRFVTGHLETFKSMLRLASQGKLELQCLPQGIMALLLEGQGHGERSVVSRNGIGTFVDPRVGRGTPVVDPGAPQLVCQDGEGLRYTMPGVDVAVFNLPAADEEGNLYARRAAMLAECREAALAARANGGIVLANVGSIVPRGWGDIFLPTEAVDAVVEYPATEQTGSVPHRRHWPMFTTESDMPEKEAIERLRFVNRLLGVTPRRRRVDDALARLAATFLAENAAPAANVNIGVGLPEEVCRVLSEKGLTKQITFFTESGVIGGLPAPGVFFGAAVCPVRMLSSADVFQLCREHLDAAVLGFLEVDSDGNVNVSNRGVGAMNAVGPGGFIDFTCAARTVIFVGSFMARGRMGLDGARVKVLTRGEPKFVERVREVTFCAAEALRRRQKVIYCTNVGAFELTRQGVELISVMPGIDVTRDVLGASPMRILLPETGSVPVADPAIVTGEGFGLRLAARPTPILDGDAQGVRRHRAGGGTVVAPGSNP